MKSLITFLLALCATASLSAFNAPSPRNQYHIPGVEDDKLYALLHLSSDDETFASCDTMIMVNFKNLRYLDFILNTRPTHKYEKIVLANPMTRWESAPFESSGKNIDAYKLRVEMGELKVTHTFVFFIRTYIEFLGLLFVLLFVVKGCVYWIYFRKKTKVVLGRFTVSQVNAALLISVGVVLALSILGTRITEPLFVLFMLIAAVLMFLWEMKALKTSVLKKNQHIALVLLSNIVWLLIATYPLMGLAPSL